MIFEVICQKSFYFNLKKKQHNCSLLKKYEKILLKKQFLYYDVKKKGRNIKKHTHLQKELGYFRT